MVVLGDGLFLTSKVPLYAGLGGSSFQRSVTKFAPHKALKSSAWGKLSSDNRYVLHHVDSRFTVPHPAKTAHR